jgi:hypothetical protein
MQVKHWFPVQVITASGMPAVHTGLEYEQVTSGDDDLHSSEDAPASAFPSCTTNRQPRTHTTRARLTAKDALAN